MIFCAASASFQRSGFSTFALSSARRRVDVSTSKMPPQQSQGLLDRFDERFGFGAHILRTFLNDREENEAQPRHLRRGLRHQGKTGFRMHPMP